MLVVALNHENQPYAHKAMRCDSPMSDFQRARLQRCHEVDYAGIGCAQHLRGIGRGVVLRGQTTTYPWRGRPVGAHGLYDQGRCGVAQEKLGGRMPASGTCPLE